MPKETTNNLLKRYLPKRYVSTIIDVLDDKKRDSKFCYKKDRLANMSKKDFEELLSYTKNIRVKIESILGIEAATITSGGVCVRNINPSTMESKKDEGLYFSGEMIDVDGFTGGFNLQIAFSKIGRASCRER